MVQKWTIIELKVNGSPLTGQYLQLTNPSTGNKIGVKTDSNGKGWHKNPWGKTGSEYQISYTGSSIPTYDNTTKKLTNAVFKAMYIHPAPDKNGNRIIPLHLLFENGAYSIDEIIPDVPDVPDVPDDPDEPTGNGILGSIDITKMMKDMIQMIIQMIPLALIIIAITLIVKTAVPNL
tara:strand:+ start:7374 stop:7904 length:531 start_codon:yes stop_codon:yes gene_type:complete